MEDPNPAAHAVLFSQDLLVEMWPLLDAPAKAALRGVCRAMRRVVDGSIKVVASPVSGFSAAELTAVLRCWPGVTDLTLHVSNAASTLVPLATTSLTRLKSLTLREFAAEQPGEAWATPGGMPALSVNLAATLQVIDISSCVGVTFIDAVGSCAQLKCLRMPCVGVSDLSPLAACSQLEELSMCDDHLVTSLAPLRACPKLRVIDASYCVGVTSIDAVDSCVQLRCLRMPGCCGVSDLSPLAACSQLEELWMADTGLVTSLAPLRACPMLRKLDLRDCQPELNDQVADLQLACTQLAHPSSVRLVGLVYELQPSMMH
ncbi:hypothetical protein FOA52_013599 [Chlamydomonas sp. UWO 241]|nr:hypothetical protein FOA52_013599 [Chlamydomonas sp. UWO 241]